MFRSGCIFVIAVVHFMPTGCLAECQSCCIEDVPKYMTCYKQCYRQCEPAVNCGDLSAPDNGNVTMDCATKQCTANFTCNEGYETSGPIQRTCLASGSWSGSQPTCDPVNCGDLNDPTNGNVTIDCTTYQCKANYTCRAGYEISSQIERTCLARGSWSGSAPTCDPIECGDLSAPANGSINIDCTSYMCAANFTCDEHFARNGTDQRTCQANGEWTLETPNCVACKPGYRYGDNSTDPSYSMYTPTEWSSLARRSGNTAVKFLIINYNITWHFNTNVADGVFFFAGPASGILNDDKDDFVGAFLKNGTLTHVIDNFGGHGIADVGSGLDDGLWHVATLLKNGDSPRACVDGKCETGNSTSSGGGGAHTFPEFYIGGVPENKRTVANTELGMSNNFDGCIINLFVNGMRSPEPASQTSVNTCYKCPDLTA